MTSHRTSGSSGVLFYPKKFGFTRRRITHEAHSRANAIATHLIRSFHFLASQVVHNTHATISTKKQTIRMTVISSFVSPATNVGNASCSVTMSYVAVGSCCLSVMHFHTKGTSVFSFIPQHTSSQLQDVQTQLTLVYHF